MLNFPMDSILAAAKAVVVAPKALPSQAFFVHLPLLVEYFQCFGVFDQYVHELRG